MSDVQVYGRRVRWRTVVGRAAVNVVLLLVAAVTLLPLLYAFFASFKPAQEILSSGATLLPETWTFDNYVRAWQESNFDRYFMNSVVVAVTVTVLHVIGTALLGYLLARKLLPFGRALQGLFGITLFIGLGTATLYPKLAIAQALGVDNLVGVVIVELASGMVVHTFLVIAFCQSLPIELEDAARVDGAGLIRTFVFIVVPLLRPIMVTIAVLGFQSTWNAFQIPYVFTLGAEHLRTVVIGVYALRSTEEGGQSYDLMLAGAMLIIIPLIIVFALLQRYFLRGLSEGALKG